MHGLEYVAVSIFPLRAKFHPPEMGEEANLQFGVWWGRERETMMEKSEESGDGTGPRKHDSEGVRVETIHRRGLRDESIDQCRRRSDGRGRVQVRLIRGVVRGVHYPPSGSHVARLLRRFDLILRLLFNAEFDLFEDAVEVVEAGDGFVRWVLLQLFVEKGESEEVTWDGVGAVFVLLPFIGCSSLTPSQKQTRGLSFFKSIYKQHTAPILTSMATSSAGDLPHFIIEDIYGGILAEDSILSLRETAVLEFAACLAGNAAPQAKGHMYGCRNVGVSAGDVRNAVRIVRSVGRILGREVNARGDMGFLKRVEEW